MDQDPVDRLREEWGVQLPAPDLPTKNNKPIDRWLNLAAAVLGILLFLLPKTPLVVGVCCVFIFLLLLHQTWNFWWIEDKLIRRVAAIAVLAVACFGIGYYTWPVPIVAISVRRDVTSEKDNPGSTYPKTDVIKAPRTLPTTGKVLEVLSFESVREVTLQNLTNNAIYIMDLEVSSKIPRASKSFPIEMNLQANEIKNKSLMAGRDMDLTTIPSQAEDWERHYKITTDFLKECAEIDFFFKDDPAVAQITDFMERFAFGPADGVIRYRIIGTAKTKSVTFPAIVTLLRRTDCTPSQ